MPIDNQISAETAERAFIAGFVRTRSVSTPAQAVAVGPLWLVCDIPGHRSAARTAEMIAPAGIPLAVTLAQAGAQAADGLRFFLSVFVSDPDAAPSTAESVKAAGYRLMRTEPLMARLTRAPIPAKDDAIRAVRRVETAVDIDQLRRFCRKRMLPAAGSVAEAEADFRAHIACVGSEIVGFTRGVAGVGSARYVAGMEVSPAFRRRGLGTALLAASVADDSRSGSEHSVLLASRNGEQLYLSAGYETLGWLMIFARRRD